MAKINIFSSSILISNLENDQLKKEILKELDISEKNNNNRVISNRGGFQTKDLQNKYIAQCLFDESIKLLKENYKFKKIKIRWEFVNFWINKNYKGNFNTPHNHPHSNFSGIYYVDVPEKDGNLVFYNNDTGIDMMTNYNYIDDISFDNNYKVHPKNNMLVIFPSNMRHMVEPHFEDMTRISLAFNIRIGHG